MFVHISDPPWKVNISKAHQTGKKVFCVPRILFFTVAIFCPYYLSYSYTNKMPLGLVDLRLLHFEITAKCQCTVLL